MRLLLMILMVLIIGGCSPTPKPPFNKMKQSAVQVVPMLSQGITKNIGSGVVVKEQNEHFYVVTAYHVAFSDTAKDKGIAIEQRIYTPYVDLPHNLVKSINVDLIASSKKLDIALLKVKRKERFNINSSPLYDDEYLEMGTEVYHVSSPYGRRRMMSEGIISRYKYMDERPSMNITVVTGSGASGGPIFNRNGEIIGILTHRDTVFDSNMGMALPWFCINNWIEDNDLEHYFER